jgi:hypothetical protein
MGECDRNGGSGRDFGLGGRVGGCVVVGGGFLL